MSASRARVASLTILILGCSIAYWYFLRIRAAAILSHRITNDCVEIADEILLVRNGSRIASVEFEPPERVAMRVTDAAMHASVPASAILSIAPQPLVRIGRTAYQSRSTQIVLQDLTMEQATQFVELLEDRATGSVVRDMSLTRSRMLREDGGELWNVRLTLTQLVFSPISTR
jgi:hypothetical protein